MVGVRLKRGCFSEEEGGAVLGPEISSCAREMCAVNVANVCRLLYPYKRGARFVKRVDAVLLNVN